MSSKTAKYFLRRYDWQQINNLFCYDVLFPDRLSQRQQILRLYKNTLRKLYDIEINGERPNDIHAYAKGAVDIRKDFEKLKQAKTVEEINDTIDKYEFYIEENFLTAPIVRDNVAYEWRHGKGLAAFGTEILSSDRIGYYNKENLSYYPKPAEYEYRDEFPFDEYINLGNDFADSGWEDVELNKGELKEYNADSNEAFKMKVEKLKKKYVEDINVFESNNADDDAHDDHYRNDDNQHNDHNAKH